MKPEVQIPLGRNRCRWEDNIKMDINKYGVSVWIGFDCLKITSNGL
jgi:hypothetical protein